MVHDINGFSERKKKMLQDEPTPFKVKAFQVLLLVIVAVEIVWMLTF